MYASISGFFLNVWTSYAQERSIFLWNTRWCHGRSREEMKYRYNKHSISISVGKLLFDTHQTCAIWATIWVVITHRNFLRTSTRLTLASLWFDWVSKYSWWSLDDLHQSAGIVFNLNPLTCGSQLNYSRICMALSQPVTVCMQEYK